MISRNAEGLSRRHLLIGTGAALLSAAPGRAHTSTAREIGMHTIDPDDDTRRMVFSPRILRAQPGDTITFRTHDPGHNSVSTEGMLPDAASPWRAPFGQVFSITLTHPGFYGYHCLPHRFSGMVGLIIVEGEGMMENFEAARAVEQRGRAMDVWAEIWSELGV